MKFTTDEKKILYSKCFSTKLEGSEKQISYAQDIRPHVAIEILKLYEEYIASWLKDEVDVVRDEKVLETMLSETKAAWWIANKSLSRYDFEKQYDKRMILYEIKRR